MIQIPRLLGPVLLALGLIGPVAAAGPPADVVPHVNKGVFPVVALAERQVGGQRAIDALGSRLGEVATYYGKSADEFKAMLLRDRRLRLDQRGRAFFIEEIDTPLPASPAPLPTSGLLDGTLAPLDQTFLLHSRAGAKRTIYLNFRGATLTGTVWNTNGTINAQAFDMDGQPGTFSTAELQRIQYIWQRVSEDFAAFDVDVTTEPPSPDRITRSNSSDDIFGTTVLITHRTGVYSCGCGGVAYLGIYDDTSDYYKPALVFYDALGAGEKNVAEAISHEAGHNMGLGHDGTATAGYYSGHGSGATGWAPIMGVGYYQALVQWSKGEYSGASNPQDDYVVMQSNGLPLRIDDHGSTHATATALNATSNAGISSAAAEGVIERPTDVDVFSFSAGAGPATLTLTPAVRSANLDALLTLRDGANNVLATANPVDTLTAGITVTLPANGTYYLSVQGTGKAGTTGYPAYGSIGQYALTVSFTTAVNQAPVAVISTSAVRGPAPFTVNFSGTGSSDPDGSIVAYGWTFGDGASASGSTATHLYSNPGSYNAQLTVTDALGLSSVSAVTITVDPASGTGKTMRVSDIAMSLAIGVGGAASGVAAVKVVDGNGLPLVGATVNGAWSGLVTRPSVVLSTNSTGVARFLSPSVRGSGVFTFTVNSVTRNTYTYMPQNNTETSDSIARP
ncbi:PKD domain-containing protein [Aquincola sp. S2]|uniref:PKD domain-containing protein n=1 Tax=Pseudaquabacterium terrae TaxID=2732868 RepID=A0ABX2E8Y5_9BURK|nr:PKD domain-containing protein [Aquabacterium terrae]NRF65375.1 PKD domain-containing protein [Aquabacterium terrae]